MITIEAVGSLERRLTYNVWNRALADAFAAGETDEPVFMAVTPELLHEVAHRAGVHLSVEGAANAFEDAVGCHYRLEVLSRGGSLLSVYHRRDSVGTPLCIAFLGTSVLAASRMVSDIDGAANAYYRHLARSLGVKEGRPYPEGFDGAEFEALWRFVESWFATRDLRLPLPTPTNGPNRYVRYPISQTALRQVDVKKLPNFFGWAGYRPNESVHTSKIERDIVAWSGVSGRLTVSGTNAVRDLRQAAVVAQVRHELGDWDGTFNEHDGSRVGHVEVMLNFVAGQPRVSLLPRQPNGFPGEFDAGSALGVLEGYGNWYPEVPLTQADGNLLTDGAEWRARGAKFALRRAPALAIALVPGDDYSGFMSTGRGLPIGVESAVLCHTSVVEEADSYLRAQVGAAPQLDRSPTLPHDWVVFRNVRPQEYVERVPSALEPLAVDPSIGIVLSGGLKVGRGATWLSTAPPDVLIAGPNLVSILPTIDNDLAFLGDDHRLQVAGLLAKPKEHVITAGRAVRRLSTVEPETNAVCLPPEPDAALAPLNCPLPFGAWIVVGRQVGEAQRHEVTSGYSRLTSLTFEPVWAVSAEGPARAIVYAWSEPDLANPVARSGTHLNGAGKRWADAFIEKRYGRVKFGSLAGAATLAKTERLWRLYLNAAIGVRDTHRRHP